MKIRLALIILLITNLFVASAALGSAFSMPDRVYIHADGTIDPSTAPISCSGNLYTLTDDLTSEVVIERNNILFDGAGHSIQGEGWGVAINMTCMNVVIRNVHLVNWEAGILGVFNNNTITECQITECDYAFKIYAQYYVITGNDVENNDEAIRIGVGGLHFIAGNNFINNKIGFVLYDKDNVIVQNNIINCSEAAFRLDNKGWTQTVYHNNLIGNAKSIIDYTYSNSIERPVQSEVAPWDNGASGNYWSDYNGTDRNGDGVGDLPEQILTYYRGEVLAFYSFTDRYPLMSQYNINDELPAIPQTLIPQLKAQDIPDNQAKALSFLKDVLGLDLTQYVPTLGSSSIGVDGSTVSQSLSYTLKKDSSGYSVLFRFTNTSLTYCNFQLHHRSSWSTQDPYNTAKSIMENYQEWTNDPDINIMMDQLNAAEPNQNLSTFTGNMAFKIRTESPQTTYDWHYKYYGVEYTGITLTLQNFTDTYHPICFSDDRATSKIGNTKLGVSKSEAIAIAEQYVKNNFTYPQNYGNGTILFIDGLGVANTTASLSTASRYDYVLYPCWDLHVVLDQKYSGNVVAVNVRVWADNGAVFLARTEADGSAFGYIPTVLFDTGFSLFLLFVSFFLICIVVVLVVVLREFNKPPQPQKSQ